MTTPTPRRPVSQSWLNQQFDENGWQKRLASYTNAEIHNSLTPSRRGLPKGTLTIGLDYYDAENKHVATIFHYRDDDGKYVPRNGRETCPKGLLIDGEWCYT
jgi:hypothetical protein